MDGEQSKTESLWMRMLRWLSRPQAEPRETLLAVSRKWLPFCAGLIVVLTFGWTWIIYGQVVAAGEYHGVRNVAIAVVNETAKAAALVVLYAVSITYTLDIAGGVIMVTARYLTEKFVEPLREKHREEGREEGRKVGREVGREEGITEGIEKGKDISYREWADWNNRRIKAADEGVPFDELPPTPPNGRNHNGHRSISD